MSHTPGTGEMRAAMKQAVKRTKGQKAKAVDAKARWKEANRQKRKVRSLLTLAVVGPLALLCLLYPLHTMGYFRLFKPPELSKALANPQATERLDLSRQYLESVPEGIDTLKNLTALVLDQNSIQELPDSIFQLERLRTLSIQYNAIKTVPAGIEKLASLETLNLGGNGLTELPAEVFKLKRLEKLLLADNKIAIIPEDIGKLKSLKVLDLKNNDLSTLPNGVTSLTNLEVLNLTGNKMTSIPDLSGLKKLKSVALQKTGLSKTEVENVRAKFRGRNVVVTI